MAHITGIRLSFPSSRARCCRNFSVACRRSTSPSTVDPWKTRAWSTGRCVKHGWSFGVSEEAMAQEPKPRRWTCSRIWKHDDGGDDDESCVACRGRLNNHNHGEVCRDQPHDHANSCCRCHALTYHGYQDPCGLCGEKFYEDCRIEVPLECGHEFHVDCIKSHLQKKNVCPICMVKAVCAQAGIMQCRFSDISAILVLEFLTSMWDDMNDRMWNALDAVFVFLNYP